MASDSSAETMVQPALGPSLGVAPCSRTSTIIITVFQKCCRVPWFHGRSNLCSILVYRSTQLVNAQFWLKAVPWFKGREAETNECGP